MPVSLARTFLALAFAALPLGLLAQDKTAAKPDAPPASTEHHASTPYDPRITDCGQQPTRTQGYDCERVYDRDYTIYLKNVSQQNDANEILVALRNLLDPAVKVFLVASQNAIEIRTYPEMYARAEAIVKALDRPHKSFRLTYTITDFDGDKRVGTQHFTMVLVDGQRNTLKQGTKIPVATGKVDDGNGTQTSFTYLDVGMNIDVTPTAYAGGVRLAYKLEQSSVGPEPAVIAGVSEPIIRQSVLSGFVDVAQGKPVILGSVDLVGTTHHLDVAVAIESMP